MLDADVLKEICTNLICSYYDEKLERVKREFEHEKKRFVDEEERLNSKVKYSESELKHAQYQMKKLKHEFEHVGELLKGNISKAVTSTLLENF